MKKKIISMVLSLVMVATTLVGCGNKTNNEDSNKSETKTEENAKTEENKKDDYVVQIPISTSLCSAPMQLAKINGYFDEVGLNWEEVNLGDNSSLDFVATGKADISYDLLQTLVQRIASGLDYQVITGVHYGCINIVASKESGITEVSQLKGKRIGCPVSLGSDPSVMLQRVLTSEGIGCTADNMEVDLQVFQDPDLQTALKNGSIDAFVSWDPFASLVAKNDDEVLIWKQAESELTKDEYCCFLGCRPEFAKEHPEAVKKIVKAIQMSCDFIQKDPEEAVKRVLDEGYVAGNDVELYSELLKSYNYNTNVEGGRESFKNCAQSLSDLGIISLNQSIDEFTKTYYPEMDGLEQ